MLKTLILICAAALPRSECTAGNARAVIQGPDVVVCAGMVPQALLASTSLRPEEEYVMIRCERSR